MAHTLPVAAVQAAEIGIPCASLRVYLSLRPTWLSRLTVAGSLALLTACGGGGDEGGGGSSSGGFININSPTTQSTYTTALNSVILAGSAFISPTNSVCCEESTASSGVFVTWSNAAGGSGRDSASVSVCQLFGGPLFLCNPSWLARIPLVLGANFITVVAADSSNRSAQATITVTRIADVTPPTVKSTGPSNGALNVPLDLYLSGITVNFSEVMDCASITSASFQLQDSSGNAVAVSGLHCDPGDPFFVIDFGIAKFFLGGVTLQSLTTYTATVKAGVRDAAGNAMATDYVWTFRTER